MEEKNRSAVTDAHLCPAVTEEPLIGTLTLARTKFFNTLYVYHCVHAPGYVLEFSCRKGTLFYCCGCKRYGKTRCITVINGMIVPGVKHPEDDHHPRCQPLELSGTCSLHTVIHHHSAYICHGYYVFNGLFFQDNLDKPFWILMKQEIMGVSGISWTICKSFAPQSRQITTPVPHHSVFIGQMPFLPPNQEHQSTESKSTESMSWLMIVKMLWHERHIFLPMPAVAGQWVG